MTNNEEEFDFDWMDDDIPPEVRVELEKARAVIKQISRLVAEKKIKLIPCVRCHKPLVLHVQDQCWKAGKKVFIGDSSGSTGWCFTCLLEGIVPNVSDYEDL